MNHDTYAVKTGQQKKIELEFHPTLVTKAVDDFSKSLHFFVFISHFIE